jgi:hypothetical protein
MLATAAAICPRGVADATRVRQLALLDRSAVAVDFVQAYHWARGVDHRVTCTQAKLASFLPPMWHSSS